MKERREMIKTSSSKITLVNTLGDSIAAERTLKIYISLIPVFPFDVWAARENVISYSSTLNPVSQR